MICVEQKLQKALSSWKQWEIQLDEKPVVVEELLIGKTNRSFLVKAGSVQTVVRINAENSSCLGIDRQRETELLSKLQTIGCVPNTLFISSEVLVTNYINGRCLQPSDLNNNLQQKKILDLLTAIQNIPLSEHIIRRNYFNYCQSYIELLPLSVQKSERAFIEKLQKTTKKIDRSSWRPVICHHDLVPENIIESEQGMFFLDWEYAAYGHPGLDFVRIFGTSFKSSFLKSMDLGLDIFEIELLQNGMDKLWYLLQHHQYS